ncbi:MAG: hypothetical protein Q9M36_09080 [Sulfurovum sp.]|nr:hypothetical protein [Sulfurovum sp.]
MKAGLYIFATIALIAIIGALVYAVNPNKYLIEFMGLSFHFYIALWFILPMLLLFFFTLTHMFFYGLKTYLTLKKWNKDTLSLEDALYWSLVNEPKKQKYGIEGINSTAVLLSKASLTLSDNVEGLTEKLSRVVHLIQKINNGEYVDLKEHKMDKVFKSGNPILIQNRLNCLLSHPSFVEGVMRASSEYSEIVQAEALAIFAQKSDFLQARKYANGFDAKNFLLMLERIGNGNDLGLTIDILNDFVEAIPFQCADFIKIATISKKYFKPEDNLALFYGYQSQNEKAQNAYLYLLFEYELLEQVSNYLSEQGETEFIKFRALYTLKKEYSGYKLEDIIDIDSICKHSTYL